MADNKVTIEVAVQGNAKAEFKKLGDNTKDFEKTAKKSFLNLGRIFDNFIANVASNAASTAFRVLSRAAGELFGLFREGIAAAQVQEDAINALNVALAASGQLTKETSEEMQAYASSLQKVTKFGDEAIIGSMALLQSLGQLDKEGLKQATSATLDLAAAMNIDLKAATLLVGKAAAGEVSSFSRYGLIIKKGADNSETFANALNAINRQFGGAAAAQVKTYSGATQQLANTWGDAKESVGFLITNNQSLISVFNETGGVIEELAKEIDKNQGAFSGLVTDGIVIVGDALIIMVKGIRLAVKWYLKLQEQIQFQKSGFLALKAIFTSAGSDARKSAQAAADAWAETTEQIKKLEAGTGVFSKLEKGIRRVSAAAEAAREKTKEFAGGLRNAASIAAETREMLAKLEEESTKIAESFAKAALGPVGLLEQQRATLQKALDAGIGDREKFEAAIDEINAQRTLKIEEQQTKAEEDVLKEIQRRADANILLQTINDDAAKLEIAKNKERIKTLVDSEKLGLAARIKAKKLANAQEEALQKDRKAATNKALSDLASLQNSKTKELAAIGKAAAITQTTISTFEGAQKAFSALAGIPIVGPALGIAAAAAAITAGVARVAAISGTPLQQGITSVPSGFPNDTFSSRLSTGERVVTQAQNEDLTQFLASSRNSGDTLRAILGVLISQNQQVNVNIGGEQIIDAIQDQVDEGRQLNL